MNNDEARIARLEKLRERAKRAEALIAKLDKLKDANPYKYGISVEMTESGRGRVLDADLLKEVFARGRLEIQKDSERELESIVGAEQLTPEPPASTSHASPSPAR